MNKILYVRVSSLDQKTDRQRVDSKEYTRIIEDKCSGSVSFFERPGGKEIINLIEAKVKFTLYVWTIDRLGRDLIDILNTIKYFTTNGIAIHFITQGLVTMDNKGKENHITTMLIGLLGTIAQMERNQIRERQQQGVELAKLKGVYRGRANGTKEDTLKFLSKYSTEVELFRKNYPATHIKAVTGTGINTLTKIKKLL